MANNSFIEYKIDEHKIDEYKIDEYALTDKCCSIILSVQNGGVFSCCIFETEKKSSFMSLFVTRGTKRWPFMEDGALGKLP